jgi:hypothetical protein
MGMIHTAAAVGGGGDAYHGNNIIADNNIAICARNHYNGVLPMKGKPRPGGNHPYHGQKRERVDCVCCNHSEKRDKYCML